MSDLICCSFIMVTELFEFLLSLFFSFEWISYVDVDRLSFLQVTECVQKLSFTLYTNPLYTI